MRWIKFTGVLGGVLMTFGVVGGFVFNTFLDPIIALHIVAGAALIASWFVLAGVKHIHMSGALVRSRQARFGFSAGVGIIVFVGILGIINYIGFKNPKKWDLTEENVYSLSEQSVKIVSALKEPLRLVAFTGIGAIDEDQSKDMLRRYKDLSDKVSVEFIDPNAKPHLLDTYGMKTGNLLYIEYGSGESKAQSRINEVKEEDVTNAIIKLTRGATKKIYFVEGHAEPALEDGTQFGLKSLVDAAKDEQLSVAGLFLGEKSEVPADAALVALISPKKVLLPQEREMLIKYVEGGGRLLMMTDPEGPADIREISAHFGINVGQDVVVDQQLKLFAGPALGVQPLVKNYGEHAITKGLGPRDISVYTLANSVTTGTKAEGATYVELAKTGPVAWAETNLNSLFDQSNPTAEKDSSDVNGPVSMAVSYEKKMKNNSKSEDSEPNFEQSAKLVVFGDSDWIRNASLSLYAHRDIILNTLNWLAGEEGGIALRPKSIRASVAPISQGMFVNLLLSSYVLPELLLIFGLVVWWRRRFA